MQTFLPYADFSDSAAVLDMKRLGKQRVENLQIMKSLTTVGYGWANHPATQQWDGFLMALLDYHLAVCDEWAAVRGYNDTCADKGIALVAQVSSSDLEAYLGDPSYQLELPPWLGDESYHLSHQSNLIRKDPAHYEPLFPGVPSDLEYVWPTRKAS